MVLIFLNFLRTFGGFEILKFSIKVLIGVIFLTKKNINIPICTPIIATYV